jgi:mono/diheme cytochrome c family protein
MKRIVKWVLAGTLLGGLLLQFSNPARTNPLVKRDFITAMKPPAKTAMILHGACYDCHSNESKWPWYSRIAPVSWLIADDVNRARRRMNLSEWPDQTATVSRQLDAMSSELESGEMPPRRYALLHANARLKKDERNELASWVSLLATNANSPSIDSTDAKMVSTNPPASMAGRALFLKNCAHCHGADARGDEGPDLHGLSWTDKQIADRIRDGKKGQMTSFSGKLQTTEIEGIIAYLHTLK